MLLKYGVTVVIGMLLYTLILITFDVFNVMLFNTKQWLLGLSLLPIGSYWVLE